MTELAHGEIRVDLHDDDVIAGLHKLEAEYAAAMRSIDRKEAEVRITGNLADLKRSIKEADALVEKHQAKIGALQAKRELAEGLSPAEKGKLTKQIKAEQDKLDLMEQQLASSRKLAKAGERELITLQRYNKEADLKAKRDQAAAKAAEQRAKVESDSIKRQIKEREELHRAELAAYKEEDRLRAAARRDEFAAHREDSRFNRERERTAESIRKAESAAYRENEKRFEVQRRIPVELAKEQQRVGALQRQYARLSDQLENIHRKQRKSIIGTETRAKLDLDESGVRAHMEAIKEELNFLGGHPPVKIKVDTDEKGLRKGMFLLRRNLTTFAEKLGSIGHVRLNLGPFSGTIRTMMIAMTGLAPVILSVVGALGSLISVAGAATVAAGTLGGALGSGLLLALGGVVAAVRPAIADFKIATQVTDAYHKAVLKYGEGSKQAKKAQEQMNRVLKTMDPNARQAAKGISKLRTDFDKITGGTARRTFGAIMSDGIAAAGKLLPNFAHRTNDTLKILRRSAHDAFAALSSPDAAKGIDKIQGRFNRFLPDFLHGMGTIASAFGRLFVRGSSQLPDLGKRFDKFADRAAKGIDRINVKKITREFHELNAFLGALGRVIVHFFGAGQAAGENFITTMTRGLNRWDKFLTSPKGKNYIGDFFERAVDGTVALSGALGPIIKSFLEWSNALQPISEGILDVVSLFSKFGSFVTQVTIANGAFRALGATIAAAFIVTKISAMVNMIVKLTAALKAARAAEIAFASAQGLSGLASGGLAGITGRIGAAATGARIGAKTVGATTAAGAAARTAQAELTNFAAAETAAGAAGASAAGGIGLLGTAAAVAAPLAVTLGAAYLVVKNNVDAAEKAVGRFLKIDDRNNAALAQQTKAEREAVKSRRQYKEASKSVADAEERIARLRKQGKSDTDAFIKAQSDLYEARRRQQAASEKFLQASRSESDAVRQQKQNQQDLINTRKQDVDSARAELQQLRARGASMAAIQAAQDKLRNAQNYYTAELNTMRGVEARATTAALNHQRALKGIAPIAQSAAMQVGFFAQQFGKIPSVKKILLSANTSQLSKIASLSRDVNKSVGSTATKNILVNAKSAEDAIRKLQAIQQFRIDHKTIDVTSPGSAQVLRELARIEGVKIPPKLARILGNSEDARRKLAQILGIRIPPKRFLVAMNGGNTIVSQLNNIRALMGQLHDKTVTLTTREVHTIDTINHNLQKTAHLGRATGGPMAATAQSQKITRPRYIVGEETPRHPEFVIATNPAYRNNNLRYWQMAGRALGIPGFYQGGVTPTSSYSPTNFTPEIGAFGSAANLTVDVAPTKQPKKLSKKGRAKINKSKKRISLKTQDPWAKHVRDLLAQQDDLEREASIRESQQMDEPETYLRDSGKKDKNGDPIYEIDQSAVSAFQASFQPIIDVRNSLIAVIAEIVRSIPLAIDSLTTRKFTAQHNAKVVRGEISHLEKRIKGKMAAKGRLGSSKKNSAKRAELQKEIDKLRGQVGAKKKLLGIETKRADDAQSDINEFRGQQKDSGFDYREAVVARDALIDERDNAVTKTAADQLAATIPSDGGSGSGSSGSSSDGPDADTQAKLDQATRNLQIAQADANISRSALAAFSSSGDIGTGIFGSAMGAALFEGPSLAGAFSGSSMLAGGSTASSLLAKTTSFNTPSLTGGGAIASSPSGGGGSTTIINVNTLHPGDPATLDAIGQAATGGISLQGTQISSREYTGL